MLVIAGAHVSDGLRAASGDRKISIFNIHTKETVTATYMRDGKFDNNGLDRVNVVMRDWRVDEKIRIDPNLIDLLWQIHADLGSKKPIHLISGYRSLKTNDMLRRTRGGQASKSLHIKGLAADVFFPDVPIERLRNAALIRELGGVGYYPSSGQPFVHVDTGSVRHWPSLPADQYAQIMSGNDNRKYNTPRIVAERTRLMSQIFEHAAPLPRTKPGQPLDHRLATPPPWSFLNSGESVLLPSGPRPQLVGAGQGETVIGAADRDWGQSLLLPSALRSNEQTDDEWNSGKSRVVVTAAANVDLSKAIDVKAIVPVTEGIAVGYARLTEVEHRDQMPGLLSRSPNELALLLKETQPIGGGTSSRRLRAQLGGPALTAPSTPLKLGASPKLLRELLSAPANAHAMTFTRIASLDLAYVAAFTLQEDDYIWRTKIRVKSDRSNDNGIGDELLVMAERGVKSDRSNGNGIGDELLVMAERAIGWIFGN